MAAGGIALRLGGTVLRFIQFAASIVILGIFSYFLAIQSKQGITIAIWERAVEGLAGASALYTLFGIVLTCFLGGVSFFAALAMVLDFCFIGASIAIAVETRGGDRDCSALSREDPSTFANEDPLRFGLQGLGDPSAHDYVPDTYHACTLLKACFAIAIINAILFLVTIFYQLAIVRHHRYEKRNAPTPNTPVLAGQKRPFWRRKARADVEKDTYNNGYNHADTYTPSNNAVNY